MLSAVNRPPLSTTTLRFSAKRPEDQHPDYTSWKDDYEFLKASEKIRRALQALCESKLTGSQLLTLRQRVKALANSKADYREKQRRYINYLYNQQPQIPKEDKDANRKGAILGWGLGALGSMLGTSGWYVTHYQFVQYQQAMQAKQNQQQHVIKDLINTADKAAQCFDQLGQRQAAQAKTFSQRNELEQRLNQWMGDRSPLGMDISQKLALPGEKTFPDTLMPWKPAPMQTLSGANASFAKVALANKTVVAALSLGNDKVIPDKPVFDGSIRSVIPRRVLPEGTLTRFDQPGMDAIRRRTGQWRQQLQQCQKALHPSSRHGSL